MENRETASVIARGVSPEAIHLFLADQEIAYPCGAQVAAFGGSQGHKTAFFAHSVISQGLAK
jgi:hypothetical protein